MFDVWYMIPGFNGYEINEERQIRSFKFHNVNVYGQYIKIHTDRKDKKYVYLSDNNNKRCKMYVEDLWDLVKNNKNKYVRSGTDRYLGGRNKIINKEPQSDISSWTPLVIATNISIEEFTPEEYDEINKEMVNISNIFQNLGISFEFNNILSEDEENSCKLIKPIEYL